jgi:hypothetical protein
MALLKRGTTIEQARELTTQLRWIEDEMRLAICHDPKLNLAAADKIAGLHDRLRHLRYEIELEARIDA